MRAASSGSTCVKRQRFRRRAFGLPNLRRNVCPHFYLTGARGALPIQAPHLLKDHLALLLQIDAKNIRVTNVEGAGCYGGNGHHLATADAAIMSQMVGQPVRCSGCGTTSMAGS